jgi:hypothetical protein
VICPLCGYDVTEVESCASCSVAGKGCDLTRCPKCGYAFPPESAVVNFFKKLGRNLSGRKVPPEPPSKDF